MLELSLNFCNSFFFIDIIYIGCENAMCPDRLDSFLNSKFFEVPELGMTAEENPRTKQFIILCKCLSK
jgi:hypothetical protein